MTCWPTHLDNPEGDCSPAGCTSASALSHRTMPLVQAPTEVASPQDRMTAKLCCMSSSKMRSAVCCAGACLPAPRRW